MHWVGLLGLPFSRILSAIVVVWLTVHNNICSSKFILQYNIMKPRVKL